MKKVTVVALVILVLFSLVALSACSDKSDEVTIKKYEIAESVFTVGDTFDKSKINVTAYKSDDTTATVSNNLVMAENDIDKLELDEDNILTKAGTFTVKVYILEENANYPEFYLGEWSITVKAKKK